MRASFLCSNIVPILPRNYGARTINTDLCLRALPRGGMARRRAHQSIAAFRSYLS